MSTPGRQADRLLDAILSLASDLELPVVLRRFVDACAELTGAAYAAINILDSEGRSTTFVQTGIDARVEDLLGRPPNASGVLAEIPEQGALRLEDLTRHPSFAGFPPGHPVMREFLGVAIRVGEQTFGNLYLAHKEGGFTAQDEEIVHALAAGAAVAIRNARLYAIADQRGRWLQAGQEITTLLLSGTEDEEEVLAQVVSTARYIGRADTAALVLSGRDGDLIAEVVEGWDCQEILGLTMPRDGIAWAALTSGQGTLVDSLATARNVSVPEMRRFGPALYAPMGSVSEPVGVLLLLRRVGSAPFEESDLATAQSFAAQAALALVLSDARQAQGVAKLADERQRIARDLHDLAIQQLFATGMQLETIRRRAARGIDASELTSVVEDALDNVDSSVRQIRSIVYALRDPDAAGGLIERLRRETSLARTGLGFAPSLVITIDERSLAAGDEDEAIVDGLVAHPLADDIVAVVREGLANAARHAHAASVQVRVAVETALEEPRIVAEVVDDGVGISSERGRRSGTGNLAARARQHGGTLSIEARPDGGTRLAWQAPLG